MIIFLLCFREQNRMYLKRTHYNIFHMVSIKAPHSDGDSAIVEEIEVCKVVNGHLWIHP
jgi:hypothetical protein